PTECPDGVSCGGEGLCRPARGTGATCREVVCNGASVDVLANGNFDSTVADLQWRQEPASASLLCGSPVITPNSGMLAVRLGRDSSTNRVDTLNRNILLPAGAISAHLVGKICIDTKETQPVDKDILTFDILDGATVIGALGQRTNRQGSDGCSFVGFTLDAPLINDPVTATFRIQSTADASGPTTFYLDTLVLTVACGAR